ncbi:predicted protein [Nematostella vectensis]|uniref:Gamma-soluble NSF attachment protein n=1 Tax=Nematostella vectensis TaxID=45351 RepID=A7SHU4_NEMVE|nr:predicted protein [Nematostella vectensis]|eukprot:XP_001628776.1 predicted protein [Nematostella vectensis]
MAMQQRKLQEGILLIKEAEKCMKTSWLKWKPDYDSAADKYMKAGTCFKAAKSYPEAQDAFKKSADAHYNSHATFHAAKALEQAATVLKEMKRVDEAVDLIEKAGFYYRESGSADTAAMALIRGAKMCDSLEQPEKAIELFLNAGDLNIAEDKIREAIEPITSAARLQLKSKKLAEGIETYKKILDLFQQIENLQMMYKTVLSLIVVYLHEGDYVAADRCFKDACGIPGFTNSDEAQAGERVLECFDQGDSDGIASCAAQPLFTYLDNEIAKLSRSLRAPGDIITTKPVTINTVFEKPRPPDPVQTETALDADTEQPTGPETAAEEEEEDEFAGGLC